MFLECAARGAAHFLCSASSVGMVRTPGGIGMRNTAGCRYVLPPVRRSAAFAFSVMRLTVPGLEFPILPVALRESLSGLGQELDPICGLWLQAVTGGYKTPVANELGTWKYGTAFGFAGLGYVCGESPEMFLTAPSAGPPVSGGGNGFPSAVAGPVFRRLILGKRRV